MAETLEHRDKIQRSLEDIHRSLVAVSGKLAQLQLDADTDTDTELGNVLEDGMTALAPLTDRLWESRIRISDGDQPSEERGRARGVKRAPPAHL